MFQLWKKLHHSPQHLPMEKAVWEKSMFEDMDSDGRKLFAQLHTENTEHAMIQYGYSAFGFDGNGEISDQVRYPMIRDLAFEAEFEEDGKALLQKALEHFKSESRIYAFFHYFGMSACGRHGKLHEKDAHIAAMLEANGFITEHENVYYTRRLTQSDTGDGHIQLLWKDRSAGDCREFAACLEGHEICWGQVHFLPQGDTAYLRWIFLDGSRQHMGLGTSVMKQLFKELYERGIRRFDTDTALDNIAAQGYYEKAGFTNCGITRSYYTK